MIALQNEEHGFAIAKSSRCLYNPLYDVVISREKNGVLLGGSIYYDYTGKSISMHIAGFAPAWISRDLLWVTFDYAFVQLGCRYVFCQIRSSNTEAINTALRTGFVQETTIPDVFLDGDLIIYRMRRENCRWLNLKPRSIRSNKLAA